MERETTVARTSLSRGLRADPSKWKGSMLCWQVPKQPWVTASFQEFSDEGWIEGGVEIVLEVLCSLKVSESTPQFPYQGRRDKRVQKLPSAWPSSNLLLMSQECSLHARFHLGLSIHCYEFFFITAIGRKSKGIWKKALQRDHSRKVKHSVGAVFFFFLNFFQSIVI